jgi:SAM-dependent methyltransferase
MVKRYDQAYFDKWYRDPHSRMWARADVERKVRLALGVAEFVLDRPVRSVLDVGCGEGTWQPILGRLRPRARYQGVDDSTYAVARYGRKRNIVRGRLGDLASLRLRGMYDLVVCCDVLHYVRTPELKAGLAAIADLARGPAYLEAYTSADDVAGDHGHFQRRSPATYRRMFRAAGFLHIGPHLYLHERLQHMLVALERPGG